MKLENIYFPVVSVSCFYGEYHLCYMRLLSTIFSVSQCSNYLNLILMYARYDSKRTRNKYTFTTLYLASSKFNKFASNTNIYVSY